MIQTFCKQLKSCRIPAIQPLLDPERKLAGLEVGLKGQTMKEGIHPEYRDVVFLDQQTGNTFITRSTLSSRDKTEIDGVSYPLFKCDVTSESHPFFTGAQTRIVETGRVEKFRQRFARTSGTRGKPAAE